MPKFVFHRSNCQCQSIYRHTDDHNTDNNNFNNDFFKKGKVINKRLYQQTMQQVQTFLCHLHKRAETKGSFHYCLSLWSSHFNLLACLSRRHKCSLETLLLCKKGLLKFIKFSLLHGHICDSFLNIHYFGLRFLTFGFFLFLLLIHISFNLLFLLWGCTFLLFLYGYL